MAIAPRHQVDEAAEEGADGMVRAERQEGERAEEKLQSKDGLERGLW